MKILIYIGVMIMVVGCSSGVDNRMDKDKMGNEIDLAQFEAMRMIANRKFDSALYFMGKSHAFFEARYNKKINP